MSALVLPFGAQRPRIAPSAFLAPGSVVIGDVEIGDEVGIWFQSVVRGDVNSIRIGARSNLQDGTVVHVSHGTAPTSIGSDVTVGHRCVVHGCTLEDGAFVGMDCTLLDHSVVEGEAMLAAGSLLTGGTRVPRGQLWAGRPARYLRELRPEELARFPERVARYVALARAYLKVAPL